MSGATPKQLGFATLINEKRDAVAVVLAYTDKTILGGVELDPDTTVQQSLRMIALACELDPSLLVKYNFKAAPEPPTEDEAPAAIAEG